jgi:hypothetical protein
MIPTYRELAAMDYIALDKAINAPRKLPFSVHCPLQMPFSHKLVFCDCALNAYALELPLGWNNTDRTIWHQKNQLRTLMVNFAFGKAPFVPDFRLTRMRRIAGGYPVVEAEFSAWGIVYKFEYACDPEGVLHIRGTAHNIDYSPRSAHIWARMIRPLESKVLVYHYRPFHWDASHWVSDDHITFADDAFFDELGMVGKLTPKAFTVSFEAERTYTESDYNSEFHWENPFWAEPEMQLRVSPRMVHLVHELSPGESATFELAFHTGAAGEMRTAPLTASFDEAVKAVQVCLDTINAPTAKLDLPGGAAENDVLYAVKSSSLQLLMDAGKYYQPCQGGLNERFFVWVWEAAESLRPMLRLGYFKEVKKVLKFIWSLQDGGCPPVGEFHSLAGAIGTTGPKWANTTGIALSWTVDYLRYSGDEDFKGKYLEKMVRAGNWIVGEIRATRISGSPVYGIMPPCRATDGDYGQCISKTDSCSLRGLTVLAELLTEYNHPQAAEFTQEAKQYKHDLDAVMDSVTHPDGFIERAVGDKSKLCKHFEHIGSVLSNYAQGANSMDEVRMQNHLRYMEENIFCGWFVAEITRGIYYIGNHELAISKAYLDLGEWKKAYAAAMVFRRFALTPDLALTQERYSEDAPGFTPWQPNASNNGRFIEMELTRLWHEAPNRIVLGGALAPWEVRQATKGVGFKGVYTKFGSTDLRMTQDKIIIDCAKPIPAGMRLIQPGGEMTLKQDAAHVELDYRPAPIF